MKKSIIAVLLAFTVVIISGCSIHEVLTSKGIIPFLIPSNGTVIDKNGNITMSTTLDGNAFNAVNFHLYQDGVGFIMNIHSSKEGKQSDVYTHELESGSYFLRLKANSNAQDEYVDIRVYLTKGDSYVYSYNVKTLNDHLVIIEDFAFGMK